MVWYRGRRRVHAGARRADVIRGTERTRAVGEALARVDPGLRSTLDGDVAVALARAGMAEQALARVAENLTLWPDDVSMRMDAGEALSVLCATSAESEVGML
jgi:Flp pilus assembly protein TadD